MKNKSQTDPDFRKMDEKEQWLLDELEKGTPVYVECEFLIRKFSSRFYKEVKFDFEYLQKELKKVIYSLRKKGKIKKQAMGIYQAKTHLFLGRNWIWAWSKV